MKNFVFAILLLLCFTASAQMSSKPDMPTAKVRYEFNGTSYDHISEVHKYKYYSSGDLMSDSMYRTVYSGWHDSSLRVYNYDTGHRVINDIFYESDTASLVPVYMDTFAYDKVGNQILQVFWVRDSNQWKIGNDSYKYLYKYNSKGIATEKISVLFNSDKGKFINKYRYSTRMDSVGNIIAIKTDQWIDSTSSWVNYQQMDSAIFYHNDINRLAYGVTREFKNGNWINANITLSNFNSDGNWTYFENKHFDDTKKMWYPYSRDFWEWDTLANQHRIVSSGHDFNFQGVNVSWGTIWKDWHSFTYDSLIRLKEDVISSMAIHPYFNGIVAKEVYYYTPYMGIGEMGLAGNKVLIYPNPASDQLSIQLPVASSLVRVTVADVMGKEVINDYIYPNQGRNLTLLLSKFTPGIYFLSIKADGVTYNQKFIKN